MIDPERRDLPSASAAYTFECPGSTNLISSLRAENALTSIPETDDAKSGTQTHQAWAFAGIPHNGLSADQIRTLEALKSSENLVVCNWCQPGETCSQLGREVRLWLHQGITPLFSGQYDAAYVSSRNRILILDGKTLYGQTPSAAYNPQMRSLVALFRDNYPDAIDFTVAILAPNQAQRISLGYYDQIEAELALRLLRFTLERAKDPFAPRWAGPWCQYCPARLQCPQAQQQLAQTTTLIESIEKGDLQLPRGDRGAQLIAQLKLAQTLVGTALDSYKSILETDPDSVPGWMLKPGKRVRRIQQFADAFSVWTNAGLEQNAFWNASSVSVSLLEAEFGRLKELKGRTLYSQFNEQFSDLINWKQYSSELVRTPTPLPQS